MTYGQISNHSILRMTRKTQSISINCKNKCGDKNLYDEQLEAEKSVVFALNQKYFVIFVGFNWFALIEKL